MSDHNQSNLDMMHRLNLQIKKIKPRSKFTKLKDRLGKVSISVGIFLILPGVYFTSMQSHNNELKEKISSKSFKTCFLTETGEIEDKNFKSNTKIAKSIKKCSEKLGFNKKTSSEVDFFYDLINLDYPNPEYDLESFYDDMYESSNFSFWDLYKPNNFLSIYLPLIVYYAFLIVILTKYKIDILKKFQTVDDFAEITQLMRQFKRYLADIEVDEGDENLHKLLISTIPVITFKPIPDHPDYIDFVYNESFISQKRDEMIKQIDIEQNKTLDNNTETKKLTGNQ
jgi:hypothetical protein